MNRHLGPARLLPLLLASVLPAAAGERVLRLDPAATTVAFVLDATAHEVHGSFAFDRGEIRFDPATGRASGEISVHATGAETGSNKRDKTMHGKVLESETYPLFVFRATRIEGAVPDAGGADVTLHGSLSIHGAEHPFALPAHVEVNGDRVEATSEFAVPYVEWDMHDPSFLFLRVAKEVQVTVSARGSLLPAEAAPDGGAR